LKESAPSIRWGTAQVLGDLVDDPRTSMGRLEFVQVVVQSVIEPASVREVAAHVTHMAAKALHV
jgi:hypothetical protein